MQRRSLNHNEVVSGAPQSGRTAYALILNSSRGSKHRGNVVLIYRFERLDFLIAMLRSGCVSFSHPSKWEDPYEFTFLTAGRVVVRGALVQDSDGKYRGNLPRRPDSVVANMTMTNAFGRFVFAQCFTEVPESERLWLWAKSDGR